MNRILLIAVGTTGIVVGVWAAVYLAVAPSADVNMLVDPRLGSPPQPGIDDLTLPDSQGNPTTSQPTVVLITTVPLETNRS